MKSKNPVSAGPQEVTQVRKAQLKSSDIMDSCHLLNDEQRRLEERINTAINKGKQTSLGSYTKNINLSKFEYNDNDGPLLVFAEELSYPFGLFGHYKLVRNYMKSTGDTNYHLTRHTSPPGKKRKILKPKRGLMLDGKERGNVVNHGLTEKSGFNVHNSLKKEVRLPKLRSGSMRQEGPRGSYKSSGDSKNVEFSKNTELPRLPARQYIDNFRRDAAEFERKLSLGFSRAGDKRMTKGKTKDILLPRIDEKTTFVFPATDKLSLSKDDHVRLPKLKETHDETLSIKKRKAARSEELKKTADQADTKRSMSHGERKAAAQRERAKWCRKTMQSNSYV